MDWLLRFSVLWCQHSVHETQSGTWHKKVQKFKKLVQQKIKQNILWQLPPQPQPPPHSWKKKRKKISKMSLLIHNKLCKKHLTHQESVTMELPTLDSCNLSFLWFWKTKSMFQFLKTKLSVNCYKICKLRWQRYWPEHVLGSLGLASPWFSTDYHRLANLIGHHITECFVS